MTLKLHNTASGDKEPFEPIDARHVTMYVCGPTVYSFVHIGNGRNAAAGSVNFSTWATMATE